MKGPQDLLMLLVEEALELRLDRQMLNYMATEALMFIKEEHCQTLTTIKETKAKIDNFHRRAALVEETCEIMQSIDSQQVEDYCGPVGKHVFSAQMEQFISESGAFMSSFKEQLRGVNISGLEDNYKVKTKLFDELKALLEVVHNKLDQLSDQKMREHYQLKERIKEDEENDIAELKNLAREMKILSVEKEKADLELLTQFEVVNGKIGQLGDEEVSILKEAFTDEDIQALVKNTSAILWDKLSAVNDKDVLAVLEDLKSEMEFMDMKLKVHDELKAQLQVVMSKFEQEKMKLRASIEIRNDQLLKDSTKVSPSGDEKVPEVLRRIKKWESEVVNENTIIGLKKIGSDDQELWNMREDREATLKEAISYLVMMLRVGPDTDLSPHATT